MKINECIEILNAVRQGRPLEYRFRGDEVWKDLLMPSLVDGDDVILNFHEKEYRVKPVRYRAYTGMEEFVNEACNHECMLIRDTSVERILVPSVIKDSGVQCGDFRFSYGDAVDRLVWYDDGTPVGVKL